jgi:hypothetical protein
MSYKKRKDPNSVVRPSHTKLTKSPQSLGPDLSKKRAISFTFKSDNETLLKSFTIYSDQLIGEIKSHNKTNKVTSQSSVDLFLKDILPEAYALVDNRLDIGSSNPAEVERKVVGNLLYGLGSIMLSNQYWKAAWSKANDAIFDLTITVDSDGFVGVNSYRGSEYQVVSMSKGIQSFYDSIKGEVNLISIS